MSAYGSGGSPTTSGGGRPGGGSGATKATVGAAVCLGLKDATLILVEALELVLERLQRHAASTIAVA
eukprot:CAMPEP_0179104016 /NCGR_PEP_ID=MMETSP0796-20121207/48228_1 /TAXON_ID=73915 /ORGANISM="Pyrodinium bahamense, Strain pbaha01" /LENGTH=66 /DNA_ID=CAMNT_0020801945 /DNA_START=203 /DNA_END=401 /DNA_ORIENTATION=+